MRDLFTLDRHLAPIPMADADVSVLYGLETPLPYDRMLRTLIDATDWRQETVRIYGKAYQQPRLVALHGDPGLRYAYSGISLAPLPWTDLLSDLKRRIEQCTGAAFNAVFLNLYRDHHDSMGMHSDDEKELGPNPVIASLSFGAARSFALRHRYRKELPTVRLPLEAGTVLLMQAATQHFWKHGIARQAAACGPRVNLTFRTLLG